MEATTLNLDLLVAEYQTLILESMDADEDNVNWSTLRRHLSGTAEWTDLAAAHLVDLVKNYGAFMLRNALAIALAAGIEDGELGF